MEGKRKEVLGSDYEEKEGVFWEEKMAGCVRNEHKFDVVKWA